MKGTLHDQLVSRIDALEAAQEEQKEIVDEFKDAGTMLRRWLQIHSVCPEMLEKLEEENKVTHTREKRG